MFNYIKISASIRSFLFGVIALKTFSIGYLQFIIHYAFGTYVKSSAIGLTVALVLFLKTLKNWRPNKIHLIFFVPIVVSYLFFSLIPIGIVGNQYQSSFIEYGGIHLVFLVLLFIIEKDKDSLKLIEMFPKIYAFVCGIGLVHYYFVGQDNYLEFCRNYLYVVGSEMSYGSIQLTHMGETTMRWTLPGLNSLVVIQFVSICIIIGCNELFTRGPNLFNLASLIILLIAGLISYSRQFYVYTICFFILNIYFLTINKKFKALMYLIGISAVLCIVGLYLNFDLIVARLYNLLDGIGLVSNSELQSTSNRYASTLFYLNLIDLNILGLNKISPDDLRFIGMPHNYLLAILFRFGTFSLFVYLLSIIFLIIEVNKNKSYQFFGYRQASINLAKYLLLQLFLAILVNPDVYTNCLLILLITVCVNITNGHVYKEV